MAVIRGTDFDLVGANSLHGVPVRFIAQKAVDRKTLRPFDILIEAAGGSKGRPTGKTVFLRPGLFENASLPITCASFARYLRIDAAIAHPEYIYWYLQHLYRNGVIETYQVQHTGIARFQFTKFADSIEIELPSLQYQQEIADFLGSMDVRIAALRETNATLEAIAQALFKSWFVDFDPVRAKQEGRAPDGMDEETATLFPDGFKESQFGRIPRGWTIDTIKNRASNVQYGFTQSATARPVGPHFLRITDIRGGTIDWSTVPYCEANAQECEKYKVMDGDIFVARTGASTGENVYVVYPPLAIFASYLIRIQCESPAFGRVVAEFMRTRNYSAHVAGVTGGSAQPNANAQSLTSAEMVFPTEAVARAFYDTLRPLDLKRAANERQVQTLSVLRDTLLPRLISGQLRLPEVEEQLGEFAGS
ncbi:restriction endonuclease subunit S [Noviherbaspirillum sp.]|uniref:restriction endonuclease subunit S n=1 Tax=Noviherbaspirillum sp. TaxID=1926288 RepID=UPI002B463831|nr:restriction endonuclease subunit S [Noviherbaspirillum sp.]HJV80162.1 restriction endonuclease subunit S [Noviherbaspirillum sp.]